MHNNLQNNGLWFDPRSLEKLADSGAWSRGLTLQRSRKVLSLEIEPAGDHWVLQGEVQATGRLQGRFNQLAQARLDLDRTPCAGANQAASSVEPSTSLRSAPPVMRAR